VVALAVGRIALADLDAVTVDAYGTLLTLPDPTPRLVATLREHGFEREPTAIAAAVEAEGRYYKEHTHEGRDASSLADLRERSAAVFLEALGVDLPPAEFAPAYVGALEFELLPGVVESLRALRARGLELAVVANWDISVRERLADFGLDGYFSHVVTAAEAGARKPEAAIFERALELLGVRADRTLHVGDDASDEQGARAAGLHFAPTPLPDAVAALR
jgi:putative hydrolase of the HAD superfamily